MTSREEAVGLVRTLAMAWKNLAAYPPEHPALQTSLDQVRERLDKLTGSSDLVFRVDGSELIFADQPIDTTHAQKFAHALYRRSVATIRFLPGGRAEEIEIFLRLLGVGQQSLSDQPLWDALEIQGVESIRLLPVDYSGVQVTDDLEEVEEQETSLARRILEAVDPDARLHDPDRPTDLTDLAQLVTRSIQEESRSIETFDPDATFGVGSVPISAVSGGTGEVGTKVASAMLLAIPEEQKGNSQKDVLRILRALPTEVRARLLRAMFNKLATDPGQASLLERFAAELPGSEVIETLRQVAEHDTLSSPALRLLEALTSAAPERDDVSMTDEEAEAIAAVFSDEDADRFNPPDHTALLEATAVHFPSIGVAADPEMVELEERLPTVDDRQVSGDLESTLTLLLDRATPDQAPQILERLGTLAREILNESQFERFTGLLDQLEALSGRASSELQLAISDWFRDLAGGDAVLKIVDRLPRADPELRKEIHQIVAKLGDLALRSLVQLLTEEEDRYRRRRILSLLTSMGSAIVPEVRPYLKDSRWYVVRNMIALLQSVQDRSSIPDLRELATHSDPRVRLEAIRALFSFDPDISREMIKRAVNDTDQRVSEAAVTLAGSFEVVEATPVLLELVRGRDIFRRRFSIRIRALQALGEIGDPGALPHLRHFFSNSFLPWPAPAERLAAWRSLEGYPDHAITELVEKGRRSSSDEVRRAVANLAEETS